MIRKRVEKIGKIEIDFDGMEIRRDGVSVQATSQLFRILRFLIDNPQRVFSRAELINAVWPAKTRFKQRKNYRTVDNYMVFVRRLIEDDVSHPTHIRTIYGAGYKFVPCPFKAPDSSGLPPAEKGVT
jgi:DNA-binding response OmpR family regulator